MSNIINIFYPWFCYLISLIFIFIYYIFPEWSITSRFSSKAGKPGWSIFDWSTHFNEKRRNITTTPGYSALCDQPALKGAYKRPKQYKEINLIILLIYFINSINYYNIYNNVDIIYQGFIIYPSLIIMFCFLLLSVFFIIII